MYQDTTNIYSLEWCTNVSTIMRKERIKAKSNKYHQHMTLMICLSELDRVAGLQIANSSALMDSKELVRPWGRFENQKA